MRITWESRPSSSRSQTLPSDTCSTYFPLVFFFATAAAAGMPAIYRTSFSQLLQSAAAFIWRRSEFIGKPPPRLKHQILFLLFLLLQQPLNSGSTYQVWNHRRGTTALRDLYASHFVRSAGITANSPKLNLITARVFNSCRLNPRRIPRSLFADWREAATAIS